MLGVLRFKTQCGPKCVVVITGGTERDKHSGWIDGVGCDTSAESHCNGYKVDLNPTAETSSFIKATYTYTGQPRPEYVDRSTGPTCQGCCLQTGPICMCQVLQKAPANLQSR